MEAQRGARIPFAADATTPNNSLGLSRSPQSPARLKCPRPSPSKPLNFACPPRETLPAPDINSSLAVDGIRHIPVSFHGRRTPHFCPFATSPSDPHGGDHKYRACTHFVLLGAISITSARSPPYHHTPTYVPTSCYPFNRTFAHCVRHSTLTGQQFSSNHDMR